MSDDDTDAAWAHQQELERRRFEEEQALLRADAGYLGWLDQLELTHDKELEHEH